MSGNTRAFAVSPKAPPWWPRGQVLCVRLLAVPPHVFSSPLRPGHRLGGPPFSKPRVLRACARTVGVKGVSTAGCGVEGGLWQAQDPFRNVVLTLCGPRPPGPPAPCPGGAERHGGEPAAPHRLGGLPQPAPGESRVLGPAHGWAGMGSGREQWGTARGRVRGGGGVGEGRGRAGGGERLGGVGEGSG